MNRPKPTSLTITFPPDAPQPNMVPAVSLDEPLLLEKLLAFSFTSPKVEIKLHFPTKRQANQWRRMFKKAAEALMPPTKPPRRKEKTVSAQK